VGLYYTAPETRLSYKILSDCSLFQAEVFSIRKVAQNISRPHDVVYLFVDSQAVIRSMQSSTVSSKNVIASIIRHIRQPQYNKVSADLLGSQPPFYSTSYGYNYIK